MMRTRLVVAGMILTASLGVARAAEPGAVLAEGVWSDAVADGDGDAVRGRIVVCERPVVVGGRDGFERQVRRAVSVYLELQDARDFAGPEMRIFCDLGRTDFRPEYKGGLRCEMVDKDGRPGPATAEPFGGGGGGTPRSQWVTLPADATIRLRTSPFGIHRENAIAIVPTQDRAWIIEDNDANEYFLSGTFTAEKDAPEKDAHGKPSPDDHVWRGTLQLPAVRIASPAARDPIVGLVAKLTATHGLWLNGAFPVLDAKADAPVEKVLPEVFEKTTPPEGKVTDFAVIEQRGVTVPLLADRRIGPQEQYTAVRVKTNVGEKIVLMQRSGTGWWSRIYGAE